MLIPQAEPFFYPGSEVGCLLVHGFTGTPAEMHELGKHLAQRGHAVLGVRLAGHATRLEDMTRTRWHDWLACVEDGYHLLKGTASRVCVIGLSLGGILALTFASQRLSPACPVQGVVVMASPYRMPKLGWLAPYSAIVSRFVPYLDKDQALGSDGKPLPPEGIYYPRDPVRQGAELHHLMTEMRTGLPAIKVPARLIYSRTDQTVKAVDRHAEHILADLGSAEKELLWVEKSQHNILLDVERQQVFDLVADFVQRM
jgi:carboxylesterase